MSIVGRDYLVIAKELQRGPTEAHWRAAVGRAYYALFLEARDALQRWGLSLPQQKQVHFVTRMRFTYAVDPDAVEIGLALENLGTLRNQTDYELVSPPGLWSAGRAQLAITEAEDNLARLEGLEKDPKRRAAVVATIRAGRVP
jgi:hypothetical protein